MLKVVSPTFVMVKLTESIHMVTLARLEKRICA